MREGYPETLLDTRDQGMEGGCTSRMKKTTPRHQVLARDFKRNAEKIKSVHHGVGRATEPTLAKCSDGKVLKDLRKHDEAGETEWMHPQRYRALGHQSPRQTFIAQTGEASGEAPVKTPSTTQALGSKDLNWSRKKIHPRSFSEGVPTAEPTSAPRYPRSKGKRGEEPGDTHVQLKTPSCDILTGNKEEPEHVDQTGETSRPGVSTPKIAESHHQACGAR